jgi:hypothetical protein
LLTVETEVSGDSKITNERGPSLGWFVGPVQLIFVLSWLFFPNRTLFQFICLHRPASWAGSRAGSPGNSGAIYYRESGTLSTQQVQVQQVVPRPAKVLQTYQI